MASLIPYGLDPSFNLEDMLCGRDEFVMLCGRDEGSHPQKKSMTDHFGMEDVESEVENTDSDYFKISPTAWTGIDFKEEENNNTLDQIVPDITVSLPNPIDRYPTPEVKYEKELPHNTYNDNLNITISSNDSPVKIEYFDLDNASVTSSGTTTQPEPHTISNNHHTLSHTDNVVPTSTKPKMTSKKRIVRRPSKITDDFTTDDEENHDDDDDDEYVPYKKTTSSRSSQHAHTHTSSDKYLKRDIRGPKHHALDDSLLRRFTERDLVAEPKSWRHMLKTSPLTNNEKMRLKELRRRALSRTYSAEYRKRTMSKVKSNKPHGTPGRKKKKSTI